MTSAPVVRLGDVCAQERSTIRPTAHLDLRYIGLESIESGTATLMAGELSKTPETPQANTFRFNRHHVLYGKLRPYLNKVLVPDFDGKCSTEIIPLRAAPRLNREYLAYFLRSPHIVSQITARTSGARMPRADMDFLLGLHIPLPEMQEQRRIIDLLSRAESVVHLRRDATIRAAELLLALFSDMFGDPATNQRGWPTTLLGTLINNGPQNGLYKHASLYGEGTPIIRIDGFYNGRITSLESLKRVRIDAGEREKYRLHGDDIIINRVNSPEYLAKSALVPPLAEDTVFESNMMRFSVDQSRVSPLYLMALLQTSYARSYFLSRAKHAINQSSVNQQDVKALSIALPPLQRQRAFATRCDELGDLVSQMALALEKARELFNILLERTFA